MLLELASLIGCKKFVEVGSPATSINGENVYTTDATAISVITGVYINHDHVIAFGSGNSLCHLSLYAGLSADRIHPYWGGIPGVYYAFYTNNELLNSTGA